MKRLLLLMLVAGSAFAQTQVQNAQIVQPLPSASLNRGKTFWTFGQSTIDCSSGTGATLLACTSNGSSWTASTGSSGSGSVTTVTGTGSPSGTCANQICLYTDTSSANPALWFSYQGSSTWQKNLTTLNSGAFTATGAIAGSLPSTPASGMATFFFNGSSVGQTVNSAGAVSGTQVIPDTAATTNSWISYIDTSGLPHKSQPTFANLGGLISAAQLGLLSSEVHLPLAVCTAAGTATLAWNFPPSTITPAVAGGCSGTNQNEAYAVFANTGTPVLHYSLTLPQTLGGAADVYLNYLTGTASGTWTPALDVTCNAANGTATNDPGQGINNFFAPGIVTAPATPNTLATVSLTGLIWPANCVAGARAHFRLGRNDTSGTATNVSVSEVIVVLRKTN